MALTAQQLAHRMKRRADLVEKEFRKTSNGLAISAVRFTKEKLTSEVYAIPEDVTRRGKKKWRRTGHLRRSERAEVRDAFTVVLVNDAKYALPRHEAGKPGHRNINPLRESHWRDDLLATFRTITQDAWHSTVLDLLRRQDI